MNYKIIDNINIRMMRYIIIKYILKYYEIDMIYRKRYIFLFYQNFNCL
jgi:hypothetical protein